MTIRVLVVEASPPVRALLRRIVLESSGLDLAGEATGPNDAADLIRRRRPDLILADVDSVAGDTAVRAMLDFVGAVDLPVVVLADPRLPERFGLAHRGEVGRPVVLLPRPGLPKEWEELRTQLPDLLCNVECRRDSRRAPPQPDQSVIKNRLSLEVLGIGASAGGPGALRDVLKGLGTAARSLQILIIQHIGAEFESSLVSWLNAELPGRRIAVAEDGEVLQPGAIRLAPQGSHLRVCRERRPCLCLDAHPDNGSHRPAIDVLFRSLENLDPARTGAALLSGMGRDGVEGLRRLKDRGCWTVVQDEASCAVFGMPRAALEAGAAIAALPPHAIGRMIARMCDPEDEG
jgi:two-component system chemotaxis response regulator CheB